MNWKCLFFGHQWKIDEKSIETLPLVAWDCMRCGKRVERTLDVNDVPTHSLLRFVLKLKELAEQ